MTNKIIFLILFLAAIMMVTSIPLQIYAAEEESSSKDSGGDNKGNDEGGDEKSSEEKSSDSSEGNNKDDSSGDSSGNVQEERDKDEKEWNGVDGPIDQRSTTQGPSTTTHDGKEQQRINAIEEKEKAAQEDYEQDKKSDSELPKVIPQVKEPYQDPNEYCDIDKCYGPGAGENSQSNCLGKYCGGDKGQPPVEDYCKFNKWDTKKCGGESGNGPNNDGDDGKGKGKGNNDWCKWHDCKDNDHGDHDHKHHSHGNDHHHNHNHDYHNDKHYHNHDDNKYYYYYSNDYSDNHATVILQLDYHGSNSHDDIRLEIGNDFDTTINFAGEPEDLVISNLDLDEGEHFSVCMENEDSGKVNCIETQIYDEDKAVYVDIRVPA